MLTPTGGDIDPEAEGSVEARCARIRGRMMWILSQLEGEDALADGALLEGGSSPKAQIDAKARELDDQRERLEARHAAELEQLERRLRVAHQTEVSGLRAELGAAKEQVRSVKLSAEAATAQAAKAVEQKAARAEAAQLGEAAALKRQLGVYEEAMKQVGPVLTASLETLSLISRAAPLPEEELGQALELNTRLTEALRVLGAACAACLPHAASSTTPPPPP